VSVEDRPAGWAVPVLGKLSWLRMVESRESCISDQDLAADVERLRRRQEQTEDNLVALAGVVEELLEQVENNPTVIGTS
jgi:hypothetical protein